MPQAPAREQHGCTPDTLLYSNTTATAALPFASSYTAAQQDVLPTSKVSAFQPQIKTLLTQAPKVHMELLV